MWQAWGPAACRYGSRCSFAHGEHELRSPTKIRRGDSEVQLTTLAGGASTGSGSSGAADDAKSVSSVPPQSRSQEQELEPQQQQFPVPVGNEDGQDGDVGPGVRVDTNDAELLISAADSLKQPKKRLCTHFMQMGACKYGEACKFIHGEQECHESSRQPGESISLRNAADDSKKFKTRLCLKFQQYGQCSYGNNCSFAHGIDDLVSNDPLTKAAQASERGPGLTNWQAWAPESTWPTGNGAESQQWSTWSRSRWPLTSLSSFGDPRQLATRDSMVPVQVIQGNMMVAARPSSWAFAPSTGEDVFPFLRLKRRLWPGLWRTQAGTGPECTWAPNFQSAHDDYQLNRLNRSDVRDFRTFHPKVTWATIGDGDDPTRASEYTTHSAIH